MLQGRERILLSYFSKLILARAIGPKSRNCCKPKTSMIKVADDVTEELVRQAAKVTEGFSGRELSKLVLKVQGAVYGTETLELTKDMFQAVLASDVAKHKKKSGAWR